MRSTLLNNKVVKLSKAKVHGYSDSVFCLGKMHRHPDAMVKWKEQLQYFQEYNEDREPVEFEWNIFPGHTSVEVLREILTRRSDHLHVNVQRYRLDQGWKLQRQLFEI